MTDDQTTPGQAPGWRVLDPDGNVVQSGGLSQAQPADWVADMIDQQRQEADATEGEQK
jgi:hypothetical protein